MSKARVAVNAAAIWRACDSVMAVCENDVKTVAKSSARTNDSFFIGSKNLRKDSELFWIMVQKIWGGGMKVSCGVMPTAGKTAFSWC